MNDEVPKEPFERQIEQLERIADGIEDLCSVWEDKINEVLREILEHLQDR
jgi:hypothetical protein